MGRVTTRHTQATSSTRTVQVRRERAKERPMYRGESQDHGIIRGKTLCATSPNASHPPAPTSPRQVRRKLPVRYLLFIGTHTVHHNANPFFSLTDLSFHNVQQGATPGTRGLTQTLVAGVAAIKQIYGLGLNFQGTYHDSTIVTVTSYAARGGCRRREGY